jgi:hypothetical protein
MSCELEMCCLNLVGPAQGTHCLMSCASAAGGSVAGSASVRDSAAAAAAWTREFALRPWSSVRSCGSNDAASAAAGAAPAASPTDPVLLCAPLAVEDMALERVRACIVPEAMFDAGAGEAANRVLLAETLRTTCISTLTMLASFVTILTLAACMQKGCCMAHQNVLACTCLDLAPSVKW